MEYFKTQKGGTGLYNGFKNVVNRKTTSKTFWECSDRKSSGRVTTEGTTVKITAEHCHPANEGKLEAEAVSIPMELRSVCRVTQSVHENCCIGLNHNYNHVQTYLFPNI